MTDKMMFPERVEDFIDGYSFKDVEEIYTNGSRLIPTFRVEQALEHYGQEIRAKAIDEFLKKICKKYTEEESKGNYKQYCCNIKQELADIAEQMKAGAK